jgi:signal transduction histidine kinase
MNWFLYLSDERLDLATARGNSVDVKTLIVLMQKPIDALRLTYSRDEIKWTFADESLQVESGDRRERAVQSVFFKLLDNAIKYAEDGDIRVNVGPSGGYAAISIESSGVPVPKEERSRIFDLYYRASSVASATAGQGMGLYQARKLARMLGGDVEYLTDEVQTNTFLLRLPLVTT